MWFDCNLDGLNPRICGIECDQNVCQARSGGLSCRRMIMESVHRVGKVESVHNQRDFLGHVLFAFIFEHLEIFLRFLFAKKFATNPVAISS